MSPALSLDIAIGIIRRLSSTEHYPYHREGEEALAEVLIEYAPAVGHARAVVDEFDGDRCPSPEALRSAATRLAEKCRCGRPLWKHREKLPDCAGFLSPAIDPPPPLPREAEAMAKQLGVPMLEGYPWFVSLQCHSIWIAGTAPPSYFQKKDKDRYPPPDYRPIYARDYPQAWADACRGKRPDPAYVERRMKELKPHMLARGGNRISMKTRFGERLGADGDDSVA